MKKKIVFEKRLIFLVSITCFILVFSWQGPCEGIELKLANLEDQNQETQIEIETSESVHYHWFYIDNPPSLIVDFLEDGIMCSFDKRIILEKGPVASIEVFCFDEDERVDFLLFKFRHLSAIAATPDPHVLTVKVNNVFLKGLDGSLKKEGEVESALSLARQKIQPATLMERFASGSQKNSEPGTEQPLTAGKQQTLKNSSADTLEVNLASANTSDEQQAQSPGPLPAQGKTTIDELLGLNSRETVVSEGKLNESVLIFSISNKKILDDFASVSQRDSIEEIRSLVNEPKNLNTLLPGTMAGPYRFFGIFSYLFGSIFTICAMALHYKSSPKRRARKKRVRLSKTSRSKRIPRQEKSAEVQLADVTANYIPERREFTRLRVEGFTPRQRPRFKIETVDSSKPRHACLLKDISLGGVCFELDSNVHIPSLVQMQISLPGSESIEIFARVVWRVILPPKANCRCGACFMTISQADREKLNLYLVKNSNHNDR